VSFSLGDVSQKQAVSRMASLVVDGLRNKNTGPKLIEVARAITADCESRDDRCEAEAIFEAVKNGTDKVPALKNGLRYVSDPVTFDYYSSAARMLQQCQRGACAGDCDDHAILSVTLLVALGFAAGFRAWGPKIGRQEYSHIYAVVRLPKHGPWPSGYSGHGFDTTVPESDVGWEPRKGEVYTVWVTGD
jgi:transglutaminase-like putative cysteine protease